MINMTKKDKIQKNKNWFRKHWILTCLGIIVLLVIIFNLSGDEIIEENEKNIGLWDKESNYTLKECYQICEEAMPTQIQENVCIGGCDAIGKEGETLDKIVNTHKKTYLEREE